MPLGNRLAEVRRARGWSQTDLAMRVRARFPDCKVTANLISRWEHSRPKPGLENAIMLAAVIGEPIEALFPLL